MTLTIDIRDETNKLTEDQMQTVMSLLNKTAKAEGIIEDAELSLLFVDNDKIQQINAEYRGKDYPTDVISFALEEMGDEEITVVGEAFPRVLGDIIVSVPKALEQAEAHAHAFIRELGFLVVHGFLHLLGYDHETKEQEVEMFALQEKLLSEFGLKR